MTASGSPSPCAISSAKPAELSEFAWKLLQAEDRRFTLRNLNLIAALAAGMVTFFAILDHFAYPEFVGLFTAFRWTCVAIIMVLLILLRSRLGKRYYKFFTVALPLVPAFIVSMTIFVSQDPGSVYYAGLSLCVVGVGFLFHWTYKEAFLISGIILLFYLIACAPAIMNGLNAKTGAGLFNNLVFLVATGFVVVSGSLAHHRMRIEDFRGRDRLRQKKIAYRLKAIELKSTLDELKETEGQLIQSGKMASLGQLSAGVIHEIGNPLNYSNQALFLLRRRLRLYPEDEAIREAVEDIQDSIDRMKEIVRELREFSHKRSEALIEFPAIESIELAVRMLTKEIDDHRIVVETDLDAGIQVAGVKNQLAQVFINLIHNAIHAMVKARTGRDPLVAISASDTGEFLTIAIRDNGPGIPEDIRGRIFDPFFTTKEVGEGTGLGLSICFRIIEAHRGTMEVVSDGATFTEFRIKLPSTKPELEPASAPAHHEPASVAGSAIPSLIPS
jgi:two-component system sensor histidine kinase PhcS